MFATWQIDATIVALASTPSSPSRAQADWGLVPPRVLLTQTHLCSTMPDDSPAGLLLENPAPSAMPGTRSASTGSPPAAALLVEAGELQENPALEDGRRGHARA